MTSPPAYVEDLRSALVGGIARDVRRRRRRLAGALPAVAVVAAGLAAGLAPRGPAHALAVTRTPETIELRIADATAGPGQLTRELRAAGIDGEVRTVPVEPALVGKWAAAVEIANAPGPEETVRLDRIELSGGVVRIPVEQVRASTGRFLFLAGRAPSEGEPPAVRDGRVPPELVR